MPAQWARRSTGEVVGRIGLQVATVPIEAATGGVVPSGRLSIAPISGTITSRTTDAVVQPLGERRCGIWVCSEASDGETGIPMKTSEAHVGLGRLHGPATSMGAAMLVLP